MTNQTNPRVFMLEGIDSLGKSTLVNSIRNRLGYYLPIHFDKPRVLEFYDFARKNYDRLSKKASDGIADGEINSDGPNPWPYAQRFGATEDNIALFTYQFDSFLNAFSLCESDARIIFDRAHLGEVVYSPLYRKYSGDYVYDVERTISEKTLSEIKLILLTENFEISHHFVDDGLSFDITKRQEEQERFVEAFNRSTIPNKVMINVTASDGNFRDPNTILEQALFG